ncbi:Transposon Ty3-I Gag-Pol polyprotein [Labeo rohita]|uniref:ribonuclease H n=1 Tax=Labeo rohita TaxID=84645 RepID=A0ABQ8LYB7_LABRO|nr:Transposon Ty3-I Gag-Pol polyprotein [Labeo rohita]
MNTVDLPDATLPAYLSYLSEEHRNDIKLINKYPTLFNDVPSQTNVLVHDINVGQSTPIKQHTYRVNPCKHQVMREKVEYLVRNGFAVASQSPWSLPCILVPKSDGSLRFCTDFRKVNSATKADSIPIPRVEDCVDRVGSSRYVTKLDLLKGYWQVPSTPRASEISAFVTPDAFMQYTAMAFGMRNTPATFHRLMQTVLSEIENCEVYLDDVVVYSMSWEDHLSTLNSVLKRLAEASLTLNLSKCEFAKAVVTYQNWSGKARSNL